MNTMTRSAIAAILTASAVPLTVNAATNVFSGKNMYGHLSGINSSGAGSSQMDVYAFQSASKDNSGTTNFSGADVSEYIYNNNSCSWGYGSSINNIKFSNNSRSKGY